jgi:hypothetical protein
LTVSLQADPILGAPLGSYPSDRIRYLIIAGAIGLSIGLVLNFTLAAIPEWWAPLLTVMLMAGLTLGLGWVVLHFWNREIILYERGFTYQEGSRVVPFLYGDILAIRMSADRVRYFGLIRRDRYKFTLRTDQDEIILITDLLYRRAAELGTRLTEQVNALLMPRLSMKLDSGEKVAFSDGLHLTREGIEGAPGHSLDWAAFSRFTISGGQLKLLDNSGVVWGAFPLRDLDNITILLELLKSKRL